MTEIGAVSATVLAILHHIVAIVGVDSSPHTAVVDPGVAVLVHRGAAGAAVGLTGCLTVLRTSEAVGLTVAAG